MIKTHLVRRVLAPAVLVAGIVVAAAAPAGAIPTNPGGDQLLMTSYRTFLPDGPVIGQKWSGCHEPSGQWGVVTGPSTISFIPC